MSLQLMNRFFTHPTFEDWFEPTKPLLNIFESNKFWNANHYSIYEKEGNFVVELAVPGLKDEDIQMHVDKKTRVLNVSAKKVTEDKEEKENKVIWHHKGQMNQSFSLALPDRVNIEEVSATCKEGKLVITFKQKTDEEIKKASIVEISINRA